MAEKLMEIAYLTIDFLWMLIDTLGNGGLNV